MKARWTPLALVAAGTLAPFAARAVDFNFAGTLQLDYLFTPFTNRDPRPSSFVIDGFTQELSIKVAADIGRIWGGNWLRVFREVERQRRAPVAGAAAGAKGAGGAAATSRLR